MSGHLAAAGRAHGDPGDRRADRLAAADGGQRGARITAQMPTGVPIATVGVDAAVNAAVLAAQIVGLGDETIQATLWKFKDDLAEGLKPRSRATGSRDGGRVVGGARLAHWLEIELLVVEALAELGTVPTEDAEACRARASFTVEAVAEREAVTRHDVAAFVDAAGLDRPRGRWIHFGLTSSDVIDTGFALQLPRPRTCCSPSSSACSRPRSGLRLPIGTP